MGLALIIILALGALIAISQIEGEVKHRKTADPNTTKKTYKEYPQLKSKLLEMANGNVEALQVLERMANYGQLSLHATSQMYYVEMKGYQIAYAFRAVGKNLAELTSRAKDRSGAVKLLDHVEQTKGSQLPTGGRNREESILYLAGYGCSNVFELLATGNMAAIKGFVHWQLLSALVKQDNTFEPEEVSAIHDFLVPDHIQPGKWFIAYLYLRDKEGLAPLIPEVGRLVVSMARREYDGYPAWFIAAYPEVVQWITKAEADGSIGSKLSKTAFERMSAESEDLCYPDQFSRPLLRMILNDYKTYLSKKNWVGDFA